MLIQMKLVQGLAHFEGAEYMGVTEWQIQVVWEMVQHLPGHNVQGILHNLNHMEMGIATQHDYTPYEHVRTPHDAGKVSQLSGSLHATISDPLISCLDGFCIWIASI
jgi:hypothetical protein